jgi:hypothetical protein
MNKIKLTKTKEDIIVCIGDNRLTILDEGELHILVECSSNEIEDLSLIDYPDALTIQIQDSGGFGTGLFHEVQLSKENNDFYLDFLYNFPNKYWEGKWGQSTFLSAIHKQVGYYDSVEVMDIDLEDDWKRISLRFIIDKQVAVKDNLDNSVNIINEIIKAAEISLGGITWIKEYEVNEDRFCREILKPLLNRMDFLNVRYTHGTREYGKDFTFSELTQFGDFRHYGLQAKAGDIRGGVNSDIDELLGQINDAFSMPYYELGSKDPRFISVFIIAISGRFTGNAKEKIIHKMPQGLIGSVYFLERERILELIERYWLSSE